VLPQPTQRTYQNCKTLDPNTGYQFYWNISNGYLNAAMVAPGSAGSWIGLGKIEYLNNNNNNKLNSKI